MYILLFDAMTDKQQVVSCHCSTTQVYTILGHKGDNNPKWQISHNIMHRLLLLDAKQQVVSNQGSNTQGHTILGHKGDNNPKWHILHNIMHRLLLDAKDKQQVVSSHGSNTQEYTILGPKVADFQ